jgi:hypothetical protein
LAGFLKILHPNALLFSTFSNLRITSCPLKTVTKFHLYISFFWGKMPKGRWRLSKRSLSIKPNKKNEIGKKKEK